MRISRLVSLLFILAVFVLTPAGVGAHAFLDRSDPEANDVVADVPESVRLWFTEPLEEQYSTAVLYDAEGEPVETKAGTVGPDPNQLTLTLPADLPNGTYTVQYRNVSAVDGHPESGYVPFTIGGQTDVVVPTAPAQVEFGGPPAAINATGRWLSLLGVAGVAGSLVTWFAVVRPALDALAREHRAAIGRRVRRVALVSAGVALAGSFVALGVQVSITGSPLSISDTLNVVSDTRYGTLWSIRTVLLLALVIFLYLPYGWVDRPAQIKWVGIGLAAAVMLPFSLISHAAIPGDGRGAAVISDWIHLGASSVWVGGLVTVLAGVIYVVRRVPREQRRELYAQIIPRFSTLAIASVVLLSLTGLYASWLHVGNLIALRETSYGLTLIIKVALMLFMVALGALNLLIIGPRMKQSAATSKHFGRTIAAEVVLGVMVLFMVGLLTSLPTARETIAAESGRTAFHVTQDGVHVSLYVTPGAVGTNRYTADFSLAGGELPEDTQVLLRTTPVSDVEGVREVVLQETDPARFEASGTELSVVGDWQLEVILRRPNQVDWRTTAETTIRTQPPEERAPGAAPRFPGSDGIVWFIVLGGALVVVIRESRREGGYGVAAFGLALVVMSVVGLGLTYEETIPGFDKRNPIAMNDASIATGEALFAENCVECHGPEGLGDGELLEDNNSPNSNLTAQHLFDHTEGELHWWISKGIGGSPMPGFEDQVTDEEIWHLVNYVYFLNASANEE